MEKFQEEREKAQKLIRVADHMLTQTFPLLKDPKLLLGVVDNIYLAIQSSIGSLLHYQRYYKKIPAFVENFEAMYTIFRDKYKSQQGLSQQHFSMIERIRDIVIQHKRSPMEFSRKDKFVICSDNYRLKTLSPDELKNYIVKTRELIEVINKMVDNNERVSNRRE